MRLFNYNIKGAIQRINGTTRLHYGYVKSYNYHGVELGCNIIPKRFGILIWVSSENLIKTMSETIRRNEETIKNMRELFKILHGWSDD